MSADVLKTSRHVRKCLPVATYRLIMRQADWAQELAGTLLAEALPRRWAHTQGVTRQARRLATFLGEDADLLEAAAWLHDIGYAPTIADTGFHPLDGARYLRDVVDADDMLCRLVAHHSYAAMEADDRGLGDELRKEFLMPRRALFEALVYCDLTTSPDGDQVSAPERIREIKTRYGPNHVVTRFIDRATPHILDVIGRIPQTS